MDQYFSIGHFAATFRLEGELILQHNLGKKTDFKGVQAVFIEEGKDRFLPFFIEKAKSKSDNESYLKLDGISTKEKAHLLCTKKVWLRDEDFRRLAGKTAPISLIGYTLLDKEKIIGVIDQVIEQPHQILCSIIINEKEVLIPLNESTIQKINHPKKQVHTDLPEGLLEIYL
jgi:16S rRNA processing protein RimM